MIAVVSSTIKPVIKNREILNLYTFEDRLEQTKHTLSRLQSFGFTEIFLVDNSPQLSQSKLVDMLGKFDNLNLYHIQQYQFGNKGVNELLMLLYIKQFLPPYQNIFKISGRYYPSDGFYQPIFDDFAVKGINFHKKNGVISTRGYWIKDAEIFEKFLLQSLDESFAYPERIVGPRAFLRTLFSKKDIINYPLNISIEFAAANILKANNYKVRLLESLGIEGMLAGIGHVEKIIE